MSRLGPALLLAALLCQGWPARAQAQTFWDEMEHPGLVEAEPLRQNLRALFAGRADGAMRALGLRIADRALRLAPGDPELMLLRARVLYDLDRLELAAEQIRALIALDPRGPWAPEAAMVLGVTLTRQGDFAGAGEAYRLFLDQAGVWPTRRAIALTNLAETQMALDDLEAAHSSMRQALVVDPEYTLAFFGLAVVQDRIGEQSLAQETMLRGLSVGLGFTELENPDVFYVPDWEIHYYLALALEALGRPGPARERWQAFLDGGGSSGPYAAIVRAHIARLDEQR